MNDPIIDRSDAVQLFRELLHSDTRERFLRLLGGPKMGKSHLLTNVFPRIAEEAGFDCVVLDLRNSQITIVEHLHNIRSRLGPERFVRLDAAYVEWISRPQIQAEGIQAILSFITMRSRSDKADTERMVPHFTNCFVDDLSDIDDRPVVLIFDAVERASVEMQQWLMDSLLVQLHPLSHVHVVVGGRTVLEPSGSYHPICKSFELIPVEDEEEYIRYCREIGAELVEQSIRDIAKALNYVPGIFVDSIESFLPGDAGHD